MRGFKYWYLRERLQSRRQLLLSLQTILHLNKWNDYEDEENNKKKSLRGESLFSWEKVNGRGKAVITGDASSSQRDVVIHQNWGDMRTNYFIDCDDVILLLDHHRLHDLDQRPSALLCQDMTCQIHFAIQSTKTFGSNNLRCCCLTSLSLAA